MMTNAKRRRQWQALVTDYRASDLSTRAWCEKNSVTDHQLRYWLNKIGATSQGAASWSCVELVDEGVGPNLPKCSNVAGPDVGVAVHVGAARVEVRSGFDAKLLSEVLRVVLVLSKADGIASC